MITNQLERLKQDCIELDYFIQRLQKEGSDKRVKAIRRKQEYLQEYIQQMTMTAQHPQALEI
jgi:aspartate aminotransferase-like enzyme